MRATVGARPTPLRVLQVVGNSVIGGAENHVLTLVDAFKREGCAVAVVCPRPGPFVDALQAQGVRAHLVEMVRAAPNDEYELLTPALWSLFAFIRRWRPDVVHSHLYPAHLHATLAAQLADVPAILTTAHTLVVRPGDPWLIGMSDGRVIAVSQAAKGLLVQAGVPARRIRVIYNGIEPRYFRDESAAAHRIRQELDIPPDAPVVGMIARLSPEKGHDQFLRVASQTAAQHPSARFVIVGTGPLAAELQQAAVALGVADRVLFTGARRDVTALNHAIDVFMLPSREEALPLAVLEAMAAQRPVVASAVGGVPEVVVDGQTGYLFEPDDRAGFVRALSTLLDRPDLRRDFGRRGQQRVRDRFAVDRMVRETLAYYRDLVGGTRRPRTARPRRQPVAAAR
jgi:glycosyltransferase involved in cell wall biosynthesis